MAQDTAFFCRHRVSLSRAPIDWPRALPNTRPKLAAPGLCGTIPFVNCTVRRRSLGALR